MKSIKLFSTIFKSIPTIDPILEKVTKSVGKRRIVKGIIRVVQIAVASYLLYKGLIDSENAIEIIKG
tara:strand:- start:329 stop:529 length:201 start_codon:yes stop_codon:yes gene_type:complete